MRAINIPRHHRKILGAVGIILSAILILWFFIYLPKKRELNEIKERLEVVKSEIGRVQGIEGDKGDITLALTRYNEMLIELEKKFPVREGQVIRDLSNTAADLGIEVLSITPSKAEISGLPVEIKGCICKELCISMELRTSFYVFGEYIRLLQNESPAVLRIDSFDIRKEGESRILVSLRLTMYMLCPVV